MTTQPRIDWDALGEQATEWLSEYIRVDTINPPGNESRAVAWFGEILDREGIPYETYGATPDRLNLVARLPGDGSRGKALILLNHTDVVPFEREHWTVEPMAGEIRDGFIWGRGATDMKGMGIMEFISFLLHKRHNLPLKRDLVFMAVADEEAGSAFGAEYLAKEHPELLDCEYVINEGGSGTVEVLGVERPTFNIGVSEKGPFWLKLRTVGAPGHGSVPTADNAAVRLVRALDRIAAWDRPLIVTPEVQEYFQLLHEAGVVAEAPTESMLAGLAAQHPRIHSLQTNSISLTTLHAGVKMNVIPAEATATLDCRLVPAYDPEEFMRELREVIDDAGVEITREFESSTPPSRLDTELYAVMSATAKSHVEDALVVPSVSTGFTDSRVFRRHGITAYGFIPVLLGPKEVGRAHGNDECLSIENLRMGIRILHDTIRGICG
ncbi:MAG: M20/M25/M40 family metallo-hydrolase [Chloroflexi bacterium]|nr:M20/M25/M40 family metallo-hydrolase [Chloroflexota bacterium]MDA1145208.1 M20/M25/M40 family metallo-hydrolase [Chloroflexota bacterium]